MTKYVERVPSNEFRSGRPAPLWPQLTPAASRKVRIGNYERLFDAARTRVRAWEKNNVK